jgi:membrane associated rhomboid family serine protease
LGFPGLFLALYTLLLLPILDRKGGGNINHSAHLFGAITGIVLLIIFGYAFSQFDILKNFIEEIKSFAA